MSISTLHGMSDTGLHGCMYVDITHLDPCMYYAWRQDNRCECLDWIGLACSDPSVGFTILVSATVSVASAGISIHSWFIWLLERRRIGCQKGLAYHSGISQSWCMYPVSSSDFTPNWFLHSTDMDASFMPYCLTAQLSSASPAQETAYPILTIHRNYPSPNNRWTRQHYRWTRIRPFPSHLSIPFAYITRNRRKTTPHLVSQ